MLCLCLWLWTLAGGSVQAGEPLRKVTPFAETYLNNGDAEYSAMLRTGPQWSAPVMQPGHYTVLDFGQSANFTITLETVRLAALSPLLGPAEEHRPSIAEYEQEIRCYVSARPGDVTAILFRSGINDLISEVTVLGDKRRVRHLKQCAATPGVHAGLSTASGLRLGLSRVQVEKMLGPPHGLRKEKLLYAADGSSPITNAVRQRLGWLDPQDKTTVMQVYRAITIWLDPEGAVSAFQVQQVSGQLE
jgi:hypothetical protein